MVGGFAHTEFETDYDKLRLGQKLLFAQRLIDIGLDVLDILSGREQGSQTILVQDIQQIIACEGLTPDLAVPIPHGRRVALRNFMRI